MKQPDPKPLGYEQHGATGFSLYLGGIGIATITVLQCELDKDGVMEPRALKVWNFGYPVKRCKHCSRPNVPVDGDGWGPRDPVKGEYCSELCKQNYMKQQNRQRAKAKGSREE
jgi:hypothetical protein